MIYLLRHGDAERPDGDVVLVGHEPDFSEEIARLTGGKVRLRKGGLAILDGSTLIALLGPKELKELASD